MGAIHFGRYAAPNLEAAAVRFSQLARIDHGGKWKPDIHQISGFDSKERWRSDADNLVVLLEKSYALSEHRLAATELTFPKTVAEDRDLAGIGWQIVFGLDEPPDGWPDAEDTKPFAGNSFDAKTPGESA